MRLAPPYHHWNVVPIALDFAPDEVRDLLREAQDLGHSIGRYIIDDIGTERRIGWCVQRSILSARIIAVWDDLDGVRGFLGGLQAEEVDDA